MAEIKIHIWENTTRGGPSLPCELGAALRPNISWGEATDLMLFLGSDTVRLTLIQPEQIEQLAAKLAGLALKMKAAK